MSAPGRVWSKFCGTNKNGEIAHFRIVDLPKDRFEDFMEVYMDYFAKEESTFRAAGVPKSEDALEEIRNIVSNRRDDNSFHIVICCLDNGDDKIGDIIGGSSMALCTPEEMLKKMKFDCKTEAINKQREVYGGMLAAYDVIKEFNLDRHFIDRGVFVRPEYRGYGIAQEFFRLRRVICKEHGIAMHGAWMTSYGTQKAAERDGWETVCEINYDDYGKKHGVTFENGPPSCKFMVARVPVSV